MHLQDKDSMKWHSYLGNYSQIQTFQAEVIVVFERLGVIATK
jgi:hypothetical protein